MNHNANTGGLPELLCFKPPAVEAKKSVHNSSIFLGEMRKVFIRKTFRIHRPMTAGALKLSNSANRESEQL